MAGNKPTLGYYKIRGICNPIRYLLAYLEVDYEDKIYTNDWADAKNTLGLLFPNLPYWIDGDTKLTESKVILRYLTKKYGAHMIPSSFELETQMELVENVGLDVLYSLLLNCFKKHPEMLPFMVERNRMKIEDFSKHLGKNDWLVGNKISYADFVVYEALCAHQAYNPELVPQENLKQFMKRFEDLPAISKYMNSPRFVKSPYNSPMSDHIIQ